MKFFKSTVITFLTNIFIFSISILTTLLTSRILGPAGKGVLGLSNNIVAFSIIVLGLGFASSNVFYVGEDKNNISNIIGANIFITIISAFILLITYFINMKYHFGFLQGVDNNLLLLVFLMVPLANLKGLFINILLGMQEIVNYNKVNMLDNVMTFILLFGFIFVFKTPFWVIISNFISVIVLLLVLLYILFHKYKFEVTFNLPIFIRMLKYGIKAQFGNAIQILNYRLDVFIVNSYLGNAQVGMYTVAVALGETMWKVSGSIGTIIYPTTTNSKNKMDMKDFINKVTRITFFIILICAILLVALSKYIILLLIPQYLPSVQPLIFIIPGISIFSISNIISNYLAGIGHIGKNIIASAVSCIITVTLDFTLIPKFGIVGAAIASSVSYTVFTIIVLFFYINITKSRLREVILINRVDIKEIKDLIVQNIGKLKKNK